MPNILISIVVSWMRKQRSENKASRRVVPPGMVMEKEKKEQGCITVEIVRSENIFSPLLSRAIEMMTTASPDPTLGYETPALSDRFWI